MDFALMEPSGFGVDVLGHVLQNLLVVVLHAGDVPVGTGQTDDHPLAADGADAGRTQSLHVVAGGDIFSRRQSCITMNLNPEDWRSTPEKKHAMTVRWLYFRGRWKEILEKGDPYYNT